jgi:hypothetical protein
MKWDIVAGPTVSDNLNNVNFSSKGTKNKLSDKAVCSNFWANAGCAKGRRAYRCGPASQGDRWG